MTDDWLRARKLLSERFALVVAGLVCLALLGGWIAFGTHLEPGTHIEQRQVSSWSTTGNFTHSTTVREENPVYPVGTTLENRTAYFGSIAPYLNGSFQYGYAASDGGNLTVTTVTWLVFQRVERTRGGVIETVYWRTNRGLAQKRETHVTAGDRVRVPFRFNVSALHNRSEQIGEQLGRTRGETEALVHASVTVNGTVNGQQISRTDRYTLPITVEDVYHVEDPGTATEEFTSTRPVTVENTHGPFRGVGAPFVLVISLCGLGGLFFARHRDELELTSEEREYLAYRDDRSDFDEWINTISLPDGTADLPRAEATSLADLVDFAIDTNNSVVEDPDDETYHVVHDGYRYVYERPTLPDAGEDEADETDTESGTRSEDDDPLAPDSQATDD